MERVLDLIPVQGKLIKPILKNYSIEEDIFDQVIVHQYKNKYILADKVVDESNNEYKYYELFENINIDDSIIYEVKEHSKEEKINGLIELFGNDVQKVIEEYELEYQEVYSVREDDIDPIEDYDIDLESYQNLLNRYLSNFNNNLKSIYILEAFHYYEFKDLYYMLYKMN